MRAKLVVAFAVLLYASLAGADQIYTSAGVLTIPSGSTVTAIDLIPYPYGIQWNNVYLVSFSFPDGSGTTEGNSLLGYRGTLDFSSPVSGVSFDWFGPNVFAASDNAGDNFEITYCGNQCSGTGIFPGTGITQINWQAGVVVGGIESITYTVSSVPEASSLLLSVMGLAALIGLALRNRTKALRL